MGQISDRWKSPLQLQSLNLVACKSQETGFKKRDTDGLGPGVAG